MSYTKEINLAKKIKDFLLKYKDSHSEFHYKELGKFLKKELYSKPLIKKDYNGKIKYSDSSLLKEDLFFQIKSGFDILKDIEYIKDYEFEYIEVQDSYIFNVDFFDDYRDFDNLVNNSRYYPLNKEKKIIIKEDLSKKRKYYFMDYTNKINLVKKIKDFLLKYKDSHSEFHYKELGKFLRKRLYKNLSVRKNADGKIKYFKTSLLKEDLFFQIKSGFDILKDIEYIKDYEFKYIKVQDSYIFNVDFFDDYRDFDNLLKNSIYYPVKGEKQKITEELREEIHKEYYIDYNNILQNCDLNKCVVDKLMHNCMLDKLITIWNSHYDKMTNKETFIHKVESNFSFLFDFQSYSDDIDFIEDRMVVTYGFSKKSKIKRDNSRLNGYLRGAWTWTDNNTDKGHFIGHSLGGNLDENIFPQKTEINRGISERGKIYRKMEKYCASNEGVFCFSRPIYCDFSTRPFILEYGVLLSNGTLWIEWFDNV